MKTIKTVSLVAFLLCFTLNLRAQSGTCGANLTWELTDSTLTISGSGAMDNSHPWSSYSSQIARVSLPEGLTNICDNAFENCSNLQSIIIPNTVTSIGYSAFSQCTSLKQVTLGNAIETIGYSAFQFTAITSITLPSSVTSVEDYAFGYCEKLTEITIPGSVSSIGNNAFLSCKQLSKATIEEGVKSIGNYVFQYCSKMTDISLPSSLISIGSSAFSSCSALASVVIPEQITTIEASTFSGCSSLKEVTLPDNLQTIGNSAFSGCGFAHIDIPNSVTTLGASSFSGCKYLTSITLPDNITIVPNSAFSSCEQLPSITIPEGVTSIGNNAFSGCSNLTSVTIPEGVTSIGYGAFSGCNLQNLSLPSSLQTIADAASNGSGAFQANTNLATVIIHGTVSKIGNGAFRGCSALSQVTLSEGTTTIGTAAFLGCSRLRSITLPEGLTTIQGGAFCNCDLANLSFPKSLTTIDDVYYESWGYGSDEYGVFTNNKSLSNIVIPENVTKMGSFAFSGCSSLKNIALNDNLLSIGQNAFENCSALPSITIPNKVTSIPTNTFYGCSALSEVTLPEGLTTIESDAFYNCTALKTIQLPKTLTSINSAFRYSGLVEIEIPEGVAVLNNTFYECNKLCKVILPSSLTTIDSHSFYNCTNLATITLPQNVRFIGTWAFYGCTLLSSIKLPNEITTIESSAFAYCRSLREITIPNKVTNINSNVFQDCSSLTSVTLPNDITTIGGSAFSGCSSLASITLPTELTSIDGYAFAACTSLRSITIPSKVNNLSYFIFQGCISLSSVTMLSPTPPTIDRTFDGAPSTLKINLVCGSKEAYMADANWAALTYPINEISSNILTVKSNDNRMGEAYIPTPNTCDNNTAIIEALPREGYQFAAWHDGNTDNPRTIIVTQDTTYIANFEPLTTYQLTVNYDPKQGHVSGIGEYYPNEEATLTVTPLGGYRFSKWGDGNTDNPRTIVMTQDTTLEALFITGDYCGDDILYTFLNDTLALNGTGDMWNLSQYGWNMYADEVLALTLSNGITSLGTNAFMDLMFLSEVTIPASVKTIHKRAFENCRSLSSVTFAENSQLQTIDHWAFYECINLHTLEIPEGVTTIGNGAFYGCAYLDSIVLPASMMSIADNGFAQCTKLSAMTVNAVTPPAVDSKTFESVNRAIPVYVPFGTGATYRATPIWQEFDIRDAADSATVTTEETNITICETELPYIWYNQACDKAGQYTYTEKYVGTDIDSIQHILNLIVNPTVYTEEHITACDSYEWNGQTYTQSGEYTYTTVAANGCDSIVTLHLTISPTLTAEETITACDSYEWNGQIYTQSGDYTYTTVAANGCDSIVTLHLTISQTLTAEEHITACDFYEWNGQTYTQSGEYTYTTVAANGCDSIVTLHLTISQTLTAEETITACDFYEWNGQTYTQSGEYTYTTVAANGCDSIVTLHLTISPTLTAEETITACDFYDWNGQTYTQSGEYTYTTVAANGCDSIVTLHLTISQTLTAEETITACDSYEWNGQTYTQSGEYTYTTVAANGCDSIVTLHLTISPTLTAEETITACDFYDWNGQTYTQSGEYTYTTDAANGCDSIVTLHLTINQSEVGATEYATICYGETYTWNNQTYSAEGEYSIALSTANGCDSVVTLHLTILPEAIIMEESASINEEHLPYLWRGQQCYDAGKYIDSEPFTNYPYCDSVIYVLNLTVEAPNKCGDNLYWHYSNNTLSITGFGAMYDNPDLLSYRNEPWYPARMENVVLPNTITHIGNVAFADCANLTNIVIPSSVTSIGDGAFSWTGLQSVTIPASVTDLGEQVFETCNNLHTILYEGTPSSISNQTVHPFIGCVHLDTIITPAALWHCTTADPMLEARYGVPHKARYIEVTDGELTKQAMKYIAKNSGTVEVLDLSAATNTTLPLGALLNNYRLSTLYLPDQIEVIPEMLAEGCHSLLEILIPATVTEIGNYAFAGCTNVWRMTVEAVLPPKVYDKTFDGIDRSISLIVPAGSEELYRQAEYWKEFFIDDTHSQSPKSNCQKILHEDHILILREGKVYTTMGQLVK